MAYKSLNSFIQKLEDENELIRIREYVNPELEITEIADRFSKSENGGKALLFENNDTNFPVLINAMGSEKRMCMALGVDNFEEINKDIEKIFSDLMSPKESIVDKIKLLPKLSNISSWMPKVVAGKGKCQEVIYTDPDLSILPVLKCWPEDGGPFVTLPMVITKDPVSGIRNVGMYRMQIFDKNLTGMHWHKHKVGARHFEEYKKRGEKMPIAVALGGDPAYTYSATAPVPDQVDEFLLAGFLRKQKVELVKCMTQDIEVPADADIIIEGYVDTEEDYIWEGPFGDHTGFYSLADWYPKFHVTCITHRKDAVYPATIVGVPPMEDAWIGKATERIFLAPIKLALLPEIIDYNLPFEGVAHNITIVKIDKTYPGQALKVMSALWGAGQMMFNKIMIVVDNNVNIHDYKQLAKAICENLEMDRDIHFIKGPMDVLDHSASKFTYGSKMGIDATVKFEEEMNEEIVHVNEDVEINKDIFLTDFSNVTDCSFMVKYGVAVISFKKESKETRDQLIKKLSKYQDLKWARLIVLVDHLVDVKDFNMIAWIASGNIDPKRDSVIISPSKDSYSKLFIDATKKTLSMDGFKRDWPNIVVSDQETIEEIDKKWDQFEIGPFIESPSLKFRILNTNSGAISRE